MPALILNQVATQNLQRPHRQPQNIFIGYNININMADAVDKCYILVIEANNQYSMVI